MSSFSPSFGWSPRCTCARTEVNSDFLLYIYIYIARYRFYRKGTYGSVGTLLSKVGIVYPIQRANQSNITDLKQSISHSYIYVSHYIVVSKRPQTHSPKFFSTAMEHLKQPSVGGGLGWGSVASFRL